MCPAREQTALVPGTIPLSSYGVYSSEQVCFNGAFTDLHDSRDFPYVELFAEPELKRYTLFWRQGPDSILNRPYGLLSDENRLWRSIDVPKLILETAIQGQHTPPHLHPFASHEISDDVQCNLPQPCAHGRIATEPFPALIGFPETILCKIFRQMPVANGGQNEAKYRRPMKPDNIIKCHLRWKMMSGKRRTHGG